MGLKKDATPGEAPPSRSHKKRESTAAQELGRRLASLAPAVLKELPVTPELLEAISHWRGMTDREARRRQMQFIGRLMRHENTTELARALDALGGGG